MKLSTKQYPTRMKDSFEMQHLKAAPKPASLILLSSGVLTIAQISGDAPFPCHNPWGGRVVHGYDPYISSVAGGRVSRYFSDRLDHVL